MGLGLIFNNFYMSDLENIIFNSTKNPPIYLRYVDDTLIVPKNLVLNFTHELKKNKITFLDVLIDTNNNNNFTTSTYKKNPVTSTLKVNALSDIKKQLSIT